MHKILSEHRLSFLGVYAPCSNFQLKQSSLEGDSLRLRKKTTRKLQEDPKTFQIHKATSSLKSTLVGNTAGEEAHHPVQIPAHCTETQAGALGLHTC